MKNFPNFKTLSEGLLGLFKPEGNWTPNLQYYNSFCSLLYYVDVWKQNEGGHIYTSGFNSSQTAKTRISSHGPLKLDDDTLKTITIKFEKHLPELVISERKRKGISQERFVEFWNRYLKMRKQIFESIESAFRVRIQFKELDLNELEKRFKDSSYDHYVRDQNIKGNSLVSFYA